MFFTYKGHMIEVNKLQLSVALGRITKDEAIEQLRKALVLSMRKGDRLILFVGKNTADFCNDFNDPENFPTDVIFNFDEWRKEENYKKIVRPEEELDMFGNKSAFLMKPDFDIVIVHVIEGATEKTDKREDMKAKIPHFYPCFETFFVVRPDPSSEDANKPKVNPFELSDRVDVSSFVKSNKVASSYQQFNYVDVYEPMNKNGTRKQ